MGGVELGAPEAVGVRCEGVEAESRRGGRSVASSAEDNGCWEMSKFRDLYQLWVHLTSVIQHREGRQGVQVDNGPAGRRRSTTEGRQSCPFPMASLRLVDATRSEREFETSVH